MLTLVLDTLCPVCGRADCKLVAERRSSCEDPCTQAGEAEHTVYELKCRCGVVFLHSVRNERRRHLTASFKSPLAAGLHPV